MAKVVSAIPVPAKIPIKREREGGVGGERTTEQELMFLFRNPKFTLIDSVAQKKASLSFTGKFESKSNQFSVFVTYRIVKISSSS